jgi:hypothetical protein
VEELNVEVDETRITVTMPDAGFWVTYQKKFGNQHLVLIGSWLEPNVTTPEAGAFRTRALDAATEKARELGWMQ